MRLSDLKYSAAVAFFVLILASFCEESHGLRAQSRTDSVHVADYNINLSVTDFVSKTISGRTDLKLVSKINGLGSVRLNLMQLTADSVFVGETAVAFEHNDEDLIVEIPEMQSGDTAVVSVYYHGVPAHDDNFGGFYFNGEYAYNVGVALYDQPHNYGRCWFPCVEEFTDKSTYSFNICTEVGKMAVCNGMLTDSTDVGDSLRVWTWRLDEPVPTYLASMAVGDYKCYSDTIHGLEAVVPVAIYAKPSVYPNVESSFVNLKTIFRMFEQRFGAYSWPRVGYVCTAMTGGAMEHATNIAYPNMFVNGTLTYQSVYAHELFHHWFGDLITCKTPYEMWINEGFASFSEPLTEELLYSTDEFDAYINHIRNTHTEVLNNIVKTDGGHYALNAVPQNVTYGMHSYQKGALVIHSLRAYMGDSLFFSSLKNLLEQYKYKNISSEEFFDVLSSISGKNLTDFYNDWINQPGFLDFEVSKLAAHGCGIYSVQIRQSGYGIEHVGTNVPVDVTFVSDDREFYTVENVILESNPYEQAFFVPFSPAFVILNYGDRLSDATIDESVTIEEAQFVTFADAMSNISVSNLDDTTFFRVEHHYTAPQTAEELPAGIHKFSDSHYWTVRFAGGAPEGKISFRLLRGNPSQLDYNLFVGDYTFDNLKLMYRESEEYDWKPIHYSRTGTPFNAYITADNIFAGQYCFAMGDEDAGLAEIDKQNLLIAPNPAENTAKVTAFHSEYDRIVIYDSVGRAVMTINNADAKTDVSVAELRSGSYVVVLYKGRNEVAKGKLVKK